MADDKGNRLDLSALTCYDRIVSAQHMGEISTRESVILRAKLLFAPNLLQGSKFEPRGEEPVISDSLTGFYKDVHRVLTQLNQEEKKLLRSFSPDLKAIIDLNRKEDDEKMSSSGR